MDQFVKEVKVDPAYSTGLAGRSKELGRAGYYFALAFVFRSSSCTWCWRRSLSRSFTRITILLTLPLAIPFGILRC
jgi:HAE1 family hydrophobic/amphiphilic exporter-1